MWVRAIRCPWTVLATRLVGQELVGRARLRGGVADDPQRVPLPGLHPPVVDDAVVPQILAGRPAGDRVIDHGFLDPAEEVHRALVPAALPEIEVDAGLVVHDHDAAALGHLLAPVGRPQALEHAHVVLVQAFGRGQVPERMAAQVQAVAVADGRLQTFVPGVVGGGPGPMAVHGEALVARQLRDVG